MEFVDIICDHKRANHLLGLDDDILDEEEIDFEDDDEDDTFFTGSETETQTYTYTYDGSSTMMDGFLGAAGAAKAAGATGGPLFAPELSTFKKTTPLFDAIDNHYWTTVKTFLTTGRWAEDGQARLPGVPLREEARQWSVTLDKSGKVTSRRLPIHAALMNQAPLDVIQVLVELYGSGVSCADSQGHLPLHLAFLYDADDEVISFLLKSYPEAVLVKSRCYNYKQGKGYRGGLLPMECKGRRRDRKNMIKLCQEQARKLSLNQFQQGFQATDPSNLVPGTSKPIESKIPGEKQEHDLMEIKKELQDLRRQRNLGGAGINSRSGEATHKQIQNNEQQDGWMSSITNFPNSLLGTALGTGKTMNDGSSSSAPGKSTDDPGNLPARTEVASAEDDTNGRDLIKPASSFGRWKRSLHKLRASRSNESDVSANGEESVEINLNEQAGPASTKSKKRFPFSNPFRKSTKSTSKTNNYLDNLTVQSSSSKKTSRSLPKPSDLTISRLSLSAVKEEEEPENERGRIAVGTSFKSKEQETATDSKSSNSARRFFPKQPGGWLHRHVAATTKDEQELTSDESVVFEKEEKQAADSNANANAGVFSSWNIEKSTFAQAMTGMLLTNMQPTEKEDRDDVEGDQSIVQDDDTAGSRRENKSEAREPDRSRKGRREKSAFSLGHQQSFLENSFLKSKTQDSHSTSHEDDGDTAVDEEIDDSTTALSDSEEAEHTSGSDDDSNSSDSSLSENDSRGDHIATKSSTGARKGRKGSSSVANFLCGNEKSPPTISIATFSSKKSTRSKNPREGRRIDPLRPRDYSARHSKASTVSDDDKKKKSFGIFRKGKSHDQCISELSESTHSAKEKKASMTLGEKERLSAANNDQVNHRRQESVTSLEGAIALTILPKKGDWREEYQDYLSATQSTIEESKKLRDRSDSDGSKSKTKKNQGLRGIIKKSRTRKKQQSKEQAAKMRQKNLDDHFSKVTVAAPEDILHDLESASPLLLDSATMPSTFRRKSSKKSSLLLEKDTSSLSTGPVVSETTVENSEEGNVYLVRVQF